MLQYDVSETNLLLLAVGDRGEGVSARERESCNALRSGGAQQQRTRRTAAESRNAAQQLDKGKRCGTWQMEAVEGR